MSAKNYANNPDSISDTDLQSIQVVDGDCNAVRETVIKTGMLMVIMIQVVVWSVIPEKIMTSCVCAGVFVCAGGRPPAERTIQLCYFSWTYVEFLSVFVCHRLTWSQRGRCTWSLICPDPPLRVRSLQGHLTGANKRRLQRDSTHDSHKNSHAYTKAPSFTTVWCR